MIKLTNRFNQFAYAVPFQVSEALLTEGFEEGSWVKVDSNGQLVQAAAGDKAYMVINSKRTGRDQISGKATKVAEVWIGNFVCDVNQFDTEQTYTPGEALYVGADGKLTNVKDEDGTIVAYVLQTYNSADYGNNLDDGQNDGFIRIVSA